MSSRLGSALTMRQLHQVMQHFEYAEGCSSTKCQSITICGVLHGSSGCSTTVGVFSLSTKVFPCNLIFTTAAQLSMTLSEGQGKKRHVLEKKNCTEEKLWTCLWLQVADRADWGWKPGRDGGQGPSLSRGGGGGMYMSLYRTIRSNKAECSF